MSHVAFEDRLYPLVTSGEIEAVDQLLDSLDGHDLSRARDWFTRAGRWFDAIPYDAFGVDQDVRQNRWNDSKWIAGLLALRLCGPVTAARRVPWSEFWSYRQDAGEKAFLRALLEKDRDWVASFADEASRARLGGNARNSGAVLSRTLRAAGRHHGLPCPTGATFFENWLAGCPEDSVEECLANDPWMPELLYTYLASGHCGSSRTLHETVPALVRREIVDRTALLGHVLSTLTAPQRPGSQQMLAKILAVLEPRPEEVAGGLDYLLGVIATSAGAVGRVLLPLALPLVTDGDELAQLTTVLAARSEKDQKKRLLIALKELPGRVGTEPVLAALDVLAADEDAALANQARSLAAKLAPKSTQYAPTPSDEDVTAPVLGLWNLEPTRTAPVVRREGPFTYEWTATWSEFLAGSGRATTWDQSAMVGQVLNALAEGNSEYLDDGIDTALALLAGGELVLSRFTNLLPDLFMAGGMRHVWPRAMALAETCAGRLTPPPTLADLLRTLVRFAPEAPRQELPPRLRWLATAKGSTKAQMEARVLRAALAGPDGPSTHAGPPARTRRGLWRRETPAGRLPEDIPLPAPDWSHEELVRVLSAERGMPEEGAFPLCIYLKDSPLRKLPHTWTAELSLAATVRTIGRGGAESLRASLVDVRRRGQPLPIVAAVDLWAARLLDVDTFWRLATRSRRSAWNRPVPWPQEWGRVGDADVFTISLSPPPDVPVPRPANLSSPLQFLGFLRACEAVLLADRNGTVLSTPTWFDGTLELTDLLARLAASGEGGVGPLDFVQALYRLRPVDAARAGDVPLGRWFTDPRLTSPDGDQRLDVGALLRHWIEAGGLPPIEIIPSDWRWASPTEAPVSWSVCASAPGELTQLTSELGNGLDALRAFPLWPDAANAMSGFGPRAEDAFPAGAGGTFGAASHALVLSLMSSRRSSDRGFDVVRTVVVMSQFGRLDPTGITQAMALPQRWCFRDPAPDAYGALAYTWRRVFEGGGMAGSWASALAVAVGGCQEQQAETGLPEFLRMLSDYAIEVPRPRAPGEVLDALRAFVDTSEPSAAREQGRILVTALEEE